VQYPVEPILEVSHVIPQFVRGPGFDTWKLRVSQNSNSEPRGEYVLRRKFGLGPVFKGVLIWFNVIVKVPVGSMLNP